MKQWLARFVSVVLTATLVSLATGATTATPAIHVNDPTATDHAVDLIKDGTACSIWVDQREPKVVHLAADLFAQDVERVTGVRPAVSTATADSKPPEHLAIIIGTLGQSRLLDALVDAKKLDVTPTLGHWEAFTLATVDDPLPGVRRALVIAGADRRGTAYGVFTLSEAVGVSPWYWWADVPPVHRDACSVALDAPLHDAPAVKYRGIFINDEDWGLQPWAAKTFEPDLGDIGPRTYAKVCELLLRLRANYLWPAMHPCTKAFNLYPANKQVADDYAIVMGSSHAEPMLRNNVTEWDPATYGGKWDYDLNRDGILRYWADRLRTNSPYENVYTLGMRGIHDSAMPGGGTLPEKVARLQRVLDDQRALLAKYVNPTVDHIPQIFVPYKEVLPLYEHGLRVPPDVTLVWPDDNHGYIRRLPAPDERQRPGGSGVYYHLSYWGKPEDYLWLCSTPPALVWEEMSKAYDHGARTLWVANVGDIKPAEVDIDFFFRLAWNPSAFGPAAQPTFLHDFAARTFGPPHSDEIASLLDEYFRLNYATKPEHLLHADFTPAETESRNARFARLVQRTDALYATIPAEQRDALYELLIYPVRCSALMNEKQTVPPHALDAYEQIQHETRYYNQTLAGGKWNRIMSAAPRKRPVFQRPDPNAKPSTTRPTTAPASLIWLEAERPTRHSGRPGTTWQVIDGLGRTGDSIAPLLTTAPATTANAPHLEFDFQTDLTGPVSILTHCIPTHAINPHYHLRYAIAIDDELPQTADIDAPEFSPEWSRNVLRASAIGHTRHHLSPGPHHTLKVWALDPGLVLDSFSIAPEQTPPR